MRNLPDTENARRSAMMATRINFDQTRNMVFDVEKSEGVSEWDGDV